ncbi:MAG TPA: ATP-binding protein, partial [Solirubrobacteraceae bacterium]
ERDELVASVRSEAERLSAMVEKLLDVSRLQGGVAEPRRDWVSIEEVVRAAAEGLGEERFDLSLDPDLPLLRADAVQLERALANVLENSARYSGGHPVSVRARAVGHRMVIRVVDRGPGIPTEERERVFEPFHRGADGHGGSGLGLAIVRGFIEANGGRVWVESLPSQGTVFVIELPLPARDAAPAADEAPAAG